MRQPDPGVGSERIVSGPLVMSWLIAIGIVVVAGLGWYAWSLMRQVKTLEHKRAQARQDALLGIHILIDSYLTDQVDRSNACYAFGYCSMRIRKTGCPLSN